MNQADAESLYRKTVEVYDRLAPPVDRRAACLFWSVAAIMAAKNLFGDRYEFMLQGGSAQWACIPPDLDDGVSDNAFAYVFEDTPRTRLLIMADRLPEMHVWIACRKTRTLFDPTTGFLPHQCESIAGMKWLAPEPPPFVAFDVDAMPDGMHYEPSLPATVLANQYARNYLEERP